MAQPIIFLVEKVVRPAGRTISDGFVHIHYTLKLINFKEVDSFFLYFKKVKIFYADEYENDIFTFISREKIIISGQGLHELNILNNKLKTMNLNFSELCIP